MTTGMLASYTPPLGQQATKKLSANIFQLGVPSQDYIKWSSVPRATSQPSTASVRVGSIAPTILGTADAVVCAPTLSGRAEAVLCAPTFSGTADSVVRAPTVWGTADSVVRAPTFPSLIGQSNVNLSETMVNKPLIGVPINPDESKITNRNLCFKSCFERNRLRSSTETATISHPFSASETADSYDSSSVLSSSYKSSVSTSRSRSIEPRIWLPFPKGRCNALKSVSGAGSTSTFCAWDINSRYMKACRTGPTSYPPHIQTDNTEFSKLEPSPLLLYYYDETAPNNVLLANDVRNENPFRTAKLKQFFTCQGGKEETYPVDADEYSVNVTPFEKTSVPHSEVMCEHTTSEGSENTPYSSSSEYSSFSVDRQTTSMLNCCHVLRQISSSSENTDAYSSSYTTTSKDSLTYNSVHTSRCPGSSKLVDASHHSLGNPRITISGCDGAHLTFQHKPSQQLSIVSSKPPNGTNTGCCGQAKPLPADISREDTSDPQSKTFLTDRVVSKYSERVSDNYVMAVPETPSNARREQVALAKATSCAANPSPLSSPIEPKSDLTKPKQIPLCCGSLRTTRKKSQVVPGLERDTQMRRRRTSVQFGSVHTRAYSNHMIQSLKDIAFVPPKPTVSSNSSALKGVSISAAPTHLIQEGTSIVPNSHDATQGYVAPLLVEARTPNTIPLGSASLQPTMLPHFTKGSATSIRDTSRTAKVGTLGAPPSIQSWRDPPQSLTKQSGKTCPQCKGAGVVYDQTTLIKPKVCGCCAFDRTYTVSSVGASVSHSHVPSNTKEPSETSSRKKPLPTINRDHDFSTLSYGPILESSTTLSNPRAPNSGCCALLEENRSISSSHCSTCESSTCRESVPSKSRAGTKSSNKNGFDTDNTLENPSRVRGSSGCLKKTGAMHFFNCNPSCVTPTSIADYMETGKSEKTRDLSYTIGKYFFDVEKSMESSNFEVDENYKMMPTYSVSYKNYPEICYDVIVPSKYSDFFRSRVPPIRQ